MDVHHREHNLLRLPDRLRLLIVFFVRPKVYDHKFRRVIVVGEPRICGEYPDTLAGPQANSALLGVY
jgi:hypothetical protein